MKEKIKQYKYFILIILILFGILSGYFIYSDTQAKKINKNFVFDTVRTLREVYESRDLDKQGINFSGAYLMKQHVENAENLMTKWSNDKDVFRKKVTKDMLTGIADLKMASEAYIDLLDKPNEKNLALFKIKLKEGRDKLLSIGVILTLPKEGINLFNSQKQEIIDYIDVIFEKELKTFEEKGQDEDFSQPQEVWAVVMLRNGLSN
jgi:hypothetical protein